MQPLSQGLATHAAPQTPAATTQNIVLRFCHGWLAPQQPLLVISICRLM
jgi:hypothetical protein